MRFDRQSPEIDVTPVQSPADLKGIYQPTLDNLS